MSLSIMIPQTFQKSRCHLKITDTGRVTRSMFHNEGHTLGATVQNSAVRDLCTHVVNTVWKLRNRKRPWHLFRCCHIIPW